MQSELESLCSSMSNKDDNKPTLCDSETSSLVQLDRYCTIMNTTIVRSIDFSKIASGVELKASIRGVNLSEVVNWAASFMNTGGSKVPIIVSSIPSSLRRDIYTDKQWLKENLLCLLMNAEKYTSEGEIRISCSITKSHSESKIKAGFSPEKGAGAMLLIEVEDTGIGISPDCDESPFQPFLQVGSCHCLIIYI